MTTKRKISLLLATGVICLVSYLGYRIARTQKIRHDAEMLPGFAFLTPNGGSFTDKMISPAYAHLVINHFSPDCEFCQDMTGKMREGRDQLGNTLVIMVTEADSIAVDGFLEKYRLRNCTGIMVLRDPTVSFYTKFGTGVSPSFFVYDENRQLVKRILGETRIENLIHR